jgi:hypothetical protein
MRLSTPSLLLVPSRRPLLICPARWKAKISGAHFSNLSTNLSERVLLPRTWLLNRLVLVAFPWCSIPDLPVFRSSDGNSRERHHDSRPWCGERISVRGGVPNLLPP